MDKLLFVVVFYSFSLVCFSQGAIPVYDIDHSWGWNKADYLMDIFQDEKDYSIAFTILQAK